MTSNSSREERATSQVAPWLSPPEQAAVAAPAALILAYLPQQLALSRHEGGVGLHRNIQLSPERPIQRQLPLKPGKALMSEPS